MAKVYLGLGTNLGDKKNNLRTAIQYIEERIGKVVSLSAFYETAPWGFVSDNPFLNAAVCVETKLTPLELLKETQAIERQLGRKSKSNGNYADRIIDMDILLYDELVLETDELIIPHPLMTQRSFVMIPLTEIAPELIHPVYKKKIKDLFEIA